ncbi:hypothetical protein KJ068_28190 [bacterium]|nr:MAG: hypothetical protein EDS67_08275 [candidate division KSB1 bacterium]MBC6950789.1 hypothetical protein [candidate division KSB1 bacterium]MCL4709060.1 hypothetical protein [bacterium]MDL1873792.1 hypothetical protein [Cytophagia bacterium CHB2]
MKLQRQKEIADVLLFDVEVSESELELYQQCLEFVMAHVSPKRLEEDFGAYPDEIEGMLQDIQDILQQPGVHEKSGSAAALETAR